MLKKDLITSIMLFLIYSTPTQVKAKNFLLHQFAGCLTNSRCSAKSGQRYLLWKKALQTKKIATQKSALTYSFYPFDIWATSPEKEGNMLWKSVCFSHKSLDIFMGKRFLKGGATLNNFATFKRDAPFYFSDIVIRKVNNRYITYIAPKTESPLEIRSDRLIYLLGEMGDTYYLAIDRKKRFSFVPALTSHHPAESTQCIEDLTKFKLKLPPDFPLTPHNYCKNIWNSDQKSYETILIKEFCY